jgi:hypothetical protein
MTPKDKANDLVDTFRIILMNEDTDCGNEILCTSIAIKHALICVAEILQQAQMIPKEFGYYNYESSYNYYLEVRKILNDM